MSHCMIAAVGKGIDPAHGMSKKKGRVKLPLPCSLLSHGRQALVSMEDGGRVMWLALAVSYFLLCRASTPGAYTDGKVHPAFCLAREFLTISRGGEQVEFGNRSTVTAVQIRSVASKRNTKKTGCTISRCRLSNEGEMGGVDGGLRSSAGLA